MARTPTAPPPAFELTGGHPCLDLANTIERRPTAAPIDRLGSYGSLLAWAQQADLITAAESARLAARAGRSPSTATRILGETRALRELTFALCTALVREAEPSHRLVRKLNGWLERTRPTDVVKADGAHLVRTTRTDRRVLDPFIWAILESLLDVTTTTLAGRLRLCEGPGCSWLFLDRGRGPRRRWCDMKVCGNRAKARRYYARHSAAGRSAGA